MKWNLILFTLLLSTLASAQTRQTLELNRSYPDVSVLGEHPYSFRVEKNRMYNILVQQQGIDVVVVLEQGSMKTEKDSPNGINGPEQIEYTAKISGQVNLTIRRLGEQGNPPSGKVSIFIKQYSKAELALKEKIRQELAPENAKDVQTADIDHFWQAFDKLATCKTHADSVAAFQTLYFDRATDGLLDFIRVRDFSAEKFVDIVHRAPAFYRSIRPNTLQAKNAAPVIEETIRKFKELYPAFRSAKVCFAVGMLTTGGTVTEKFVLIGTEISTSTSSTDLSELKNSALAKVMSKGEDAGQKLRDIVSHEFVHTQQRTPADPKAIRCNLLNACLQEGIADFIGEKISGSQLNKVAQTYGDEHEKELWTKFKAEMCSNNTSNWLYNFTSVKDQPADLGYYMGYTIAREYFKHAADKNKAIVDIIEMNNPLRFVEESGYDLKFR